MLVQVVVSMATLAEKIAAGTNKRRARKFEHQCNCVLYARTNLKGVGVCHSFNLVHEIMMCISPACGRDDVECTVMKV